MSQLNQDLSIFVYFVYLYLSALCSLSVAVGVVYHPGPVSASHLSCFLALLFAFVLVPVLVFCSCLVSWPVLSRGLVFAFVLYHVFCDYL